MSLAYTTHLGIRLKERRITRSQVDATITSPDYVEVVKQGKRYKKKFGSQTLTAVVTITKSKQPLVLSAWIDPPNPGTKDATKKMLYTKYQTSKGLIKLWYGIRLSLLG